MIGRRGFIGRITLAIVGVPLVGEAQPARKIPRIGVLGGQTPERSPVLSLGDGLRELGYVDGRDVVIEWRWAHGKNERFPELVAELLRLNVDVIVAPTPSGVLAARKATTTVPIVMGFVSNPVDLGFVASLARPGGNVTGIGVPNFEITGKRPQLLREISPGMTRVAFLEDPAQPGMSTERKGTEAAARSLGMEVGVWRAQTPQELDQAFAEIAAKRTAAVVIPPSAFFYSQRVAIADLAARRRLPTSAWTREFPEAGALLSYGASQRELARRSAYFVDKILKGARPADIPVEEPTKYELVINVKTAKALGLTIPPAILGRADQVIE